MPSQLFDTAKMYKLDGTVCNQRSGVCYQGLGVFSKTKKFEGKYFAHGKIDYFHVGSCHRTRTLTELCQQKRSKNRKSLDFTLCDIGSVEGVSGCGFKFFAAEREKGRHSFALMFFDNDELLLGSVTQCNGRKIRWDGTSACQSSRDNYQEIYFKSPVRWSKKGYEECPDMVELAPGRYRYNLGLGFCVYTFTDEKNYHSHITYGHEREPIRIVEPRKSFWFFGD